MFISCTLYFNCKNYILKKINKHIFSKYSVDKLSQKSKIISDIQIELEKIKGALTGYSEEELDTLTLPHPLHHQKQIESAIAEYKKHLKRK